MCSDSLSMQCFRTDTTLCVPNPQFNYSKKHFLCPSPSMPVHKLLLSSFSALGKSPGGGVPFEVWSRFYYPNVRDQLLAKVGEVQNIAQRKKENFSQLVTESDNLLSVITRHASLNFARVMLAYTVVSLKRYTRKFGISCTFNNFDKRACKFGLPYFSDHKIIRASCLRKNGFEFQSV